MLHHHHQRRGRLRRPAPVPALLPPRDPFLCLSRVYHHRPFSASVESPRVVASRCGVGTHRRPLHVASMAGHRIPSPAPIHPRHCRRQRLSYRDRAPGLAVSAGHRASCRRRGAPSTRAWALLKRISPPRQRWYTPARAPLGGRPEQGARRPPPTDSQRALQDSDLQWSRCRRWPPSLIRCVRRPYWPSPLLPLLR